MKIGIDIDGVLATFDDNFAKILTKLTGIEFPPDSTTWPTEWDWDSATMRAHGLSEERIKAVQNAAWGEVRNPATNFWYNLPQISENMKVVNTLYWEGQHDLYFITSRPSITAKAQTEDWFDNYLGAPTTVLICSKKGAAAEALNLDIYIDDRGENILDVEWRSPSTRAYLIDKPYNKQFNVARRVPNLAQVMMREEL